MTPEQVKGTKDLICDLEFIENQIVMGMRDDPQRFVHLAQALSRVVFISSRLQTKLDAQAPAPSEDDGIREAVSNAVNAMRNY